MVTCYLDQLFDENTPRDVATERPHPEREFNFFTDNRDCRHFVAPRVGFAWWCTSAHLKLITVTIVCDVGDIDRNSAWRSIEQYRSASHTISPIAPLIIDAISIVSSCLMYCKCVSPVGPPPSRVVYSLNIWLPWLAAVPVNPR